MKQFKSHGRNYTSFSELGSWIKNREAFRNSTGSFRGGPVAYASTGRLPERFVAQFKEQFYRNEIKYVIYSYGTPIAWFFGTGWFIPAVKYSTTTTIHQNKVQAAL